ncbi:MAG: GxxExxY protein [Gemmatimonadota bacterium]
MPSLIDLRPLTEQIIGSALRIHSALGPGMFESVYRTVLADDLRRKGFGVETEKAFPLIFEGRRFEKGFRVDIDVERAVIVEVKCKPQLAPVHFTQLLTYIKLLDRKVGLLLNFGEHSLRIKRLAN